MLSIPTGPGNKISIPELKLLLIDTLSGVAVCLNIVNERFGMGFFFSSNNTFHKTF